MIAASSYNSGGAGTVTSDGKNRNAAITNSQFPHKLHKMLDAAATDRFGDIVRWELGGHAFKVYNIDEFVQKVLPNYFKQSKHRSFQR